MSVIKFTQKTKQFFLHATWLGSLYHLGFAQALVTVSNPYRIPWQCSSANGNWVCHENISTDRGLYQTNLSSEQHTAALEKALGWVRDDSSNVKNCSICGGHYYEAPLPVSSKAGSLAGSKTKIVPGSTYYKVQGQLVLGNGVVVTQPGRELYADQAVISPNLQTGKLQKIVATGNIRLHQTGQLWLGKQLSANLTNHQAEVDDVTYLIRVSADKPNFLQNAEEASDPNFTGYARGHADTVLQLSENQYSLTHATYTTCPPASSTWMLEAEKIDLDQVSGRGTAENTFLMIHGVPIFYAPYFSFPINKERKTGFLYANASYNGRNGLALSFPYYINLAPNYDDTITPTIYTKRGVLFDNLFRYLTHSSNGSVDFQVIPDDQLSHQTRYAYAINDTTNITDNWQAVLDYNKVSDQNYLQDFGSQTSAVVANQVLLNRSLALNYNSLHWTFNGLVQSYQIVNPLLTTANRPYNEYPMTELQAQYPNVLKPFSISLDSGFTNFQKSSAIGSVNPIDGQRAYVAPTISMPLTRSYGFFTPALTVNATGYNLQNNQINGYPTSSLSRTLPIFDIDTGLFFDRDFDFNGSNYTQTLEPRLFYLFVPYANQNNIPVFDTSINSFNYNQLFSTNRFSGMDRIGDANQISAALSTTVNNSLGQELMDAAIGQIYYFKDRQVSLCTNNPGQPPCIITENPQYNQTFSDIVGMADYYFNSIWSVNANMSYNPKFNVMDAQSYQLEYKPDGKNLFNIGYETNNYDYGLLSNEQILSGLTPPRISEMNASALWNVAQSWSLVGSVSYSLNYKNIISQFAGLQYDACCWAARFIVYQYIVNNNPNLPAVISGPKDTTYMVQFELKGLGNNSSTQVNTLLNGIPGYNNQLGF